MRLQTEQGSVRYDGGSFGGEDEFFRFDHKDMKKQFSCMY
jgi:hypothetical protein